MAEPTDAVTAAQHAAFGNKGHGQLWTLHEILLANQLMLAQLLTQGADGITIKRADFDENTATTHANVITAVAGKKISIVAMMLISHGDQTMDLLDVAASLTGPVAMREGTGFILQRVKPPDFHYQNAAVNSAINITLTTAVQVVGNIWYYEA